VFGLVLVRRYFSALNRFCTLSPIVSWPLPGYTLPSIRRTSLTGSERRTTQRFTMRLPLTVRWTTGAAVGETSTESRDVSSRGVYFYLGKDVKEGSPVEILLTLPNEITLAGPVRVRCLGRVQRTESRDEAPVVVLTAPWTISYLHSLTFRTADIPHPLGHDHDCPMKPAGSSARPRLDRGMPMPETPAQDLLTLPKTTSASQTERMATPEELYALKRIAE